MNRTSLVEVDVNSEIARLSGEHSAIEFRLRELDRHLSLTLDEQLERANLKKAKLRLKDGLLHLQRARR